MKSLKTLLCVTATTAALVTFDLCGTVARADTILEPRTLTVHFEDLDTNSAQGAAILYQRIKVAAENVCGGFAPVRSLELMSRHASCVQAAMSDAVARVNRPAVTDYALARGVVPPGPPIKVKVARNG